MTQDDADDYDSPWKEAIERHLSAFLAFFFPAAHAEIDWTQPVTFLDQELRAVVRDAASGRRQVDKLVSVRRTDGRFDPIYIHIEVQADDTAGFAKRMFIYHYRLYDRYQKPVASLALLADQRSNWQPDRFDYEALGCRLDFRYPVAKLLDWVGSHARLADSTNPFALLTQAHLATQATRHDMAARKAIKWQLVQDLYQRDFERQTVLDMYAMLDWMLWLPSEIQQAFRQELAIFEEEKRMRYVTSNERIAKAEGIQQGIQQGLQQGQARVLERQLIHRFGELPDWAHARLAQATDDDLDVWADAVLSAASIAQVFGDARH